MPWPGSARPPSPASVGRTVPAARAWTRAGELGERVSGLPGWAAVPAGIAGISLLIAVFGFYWDVATHIDNGRDPGPFANPSHWFILIGLIGIAVAGYVSLPRDRGGPSELTAPA